MRRLFSPGIATPLLLTITGVLLILAGQLNLDAPVAASLPPIVIPTPPQETATPVPSDETPAPTPVPTPIPEDWIAKQIEIPSVGINLRVTQSTTPAQDDFPPVDGAWILRESSQPGRGTNTYIVAHARKGLFKPLWNVWLGAEVRILMSDGQVLRYVVTEIHPNTPCPDTRYDPMPNPPLALQYAEPGCPGAVWTRPTDHERLTLQTSQGFNRNYGELIVVADPIR